MDQWAGPTGVTPLLVCCSKWRLQGPSIEAEAEVWRYGALELKMLAPPPRQTPPYPPVNRGSARCPTCQRYSGVVSGYPRTWPLWGSRFRGSIIHAMELSTFQTLILGQPSSMTSRVLGFKAATILEPHSPILWLESRNIPVKHRGPT